MNEFQKLYTCKSCGKEFVRYKTLVRYDNTFCSFKCYHHASIAFIKEPLVTITKNNTSFKITFNNESLNIIDFSEVYVKEIEGRIIIGRCGIDHSKRLRVIKNIIYFEFKTIDNPIGFYRIELEEEGQDEFELIPYEND